MATTISRWQPPLPLSLPQQTSTATPLLSMTLWWTARLSDCLTAPILPQSSHISIYSCRRRRRRSWCWSWPCWCWCCIDMQLTEPRDGDGLGFGCGCECECGFEQGMGQLTQRDLFYRRMHFLWLNDSCEFFKRCDSSQASLRLFAPPPVQ